MQKIIFLFLALSLIACQQDEADKPKVETRGTDAVGLNKAVLQAELLEVGPIKPVQYGFLWSTINGVDVISAQGKVVVGESSEGELPFSYEITNLSPGTDYFVRAFASTNGFTNICYGEEIAFTTSLPEDYVRTLAAEELTNSTAKLNGELIDLNELVTAQYGFVWANIPFNSILEGNVVVTGTASTPLTYQSSLTSLQAQTTYYYRAFVSNHETTLVVYGDLLSFTTAN
jgi:hypothetical protein